MTSRPRTSTLVLLGTFVLTLALYLNVRPDPTPPTELVPAVRVPVSTATSRPDPTVGSTSTSSTLPATGSTNTSTSSTSPTAPTTAPPSSTTARSAPGSTSGTAP